MKKLQACVLPLMAAVLSVLAFHGLNFMLLLGGFSIIYLVLAGCYSIACCIGESLEKNIHINIGSAGKLWLFLFITFQIVCAAMAATCYFYPLAVARCIQVAGIYAAVLIMLGLVLLTLRHTLTRAVSH